MFGGLEIKGASAPASTNEKQDEKETSGPTTTTAASGFSFMSTPVAPEPAMSVAAPEPVPAAAPASSGFSFMSSMTTTNETSTSTASDPNEGGPTTSGVSSGFSFMGAPASTGTNDAIKEEEVPKPEDEKSAAVLPSSGFSFLSPENPIEPVVNKVVEENVMKAEDSNPVSSSFNFLMSTTSENAPIETQSLPVQAETSAPSKPQTNESIFSMLSSNLGQAESLNESTSTPAPAPVPPPQPADITSSWGMNTKPPLPATSTAISAAKTLTSTSDILSQANPSQPTGTGVFFGGAAKPKPRTVKKRARGKKIGVGSAANSNTSLPPPALPEPTTITSQPAAQSQANDGENQGATTASKETENQATSSKSLSHEAEEAANRAEEFISNKLSSNPPKSTSSSYMGRYSGDKSVVEDYGDVDDNQSKNNNGNKVLEKEQSEEYKKAKAAAEEAKNLNPSTINRKMGFMGGGIGGLFKRGFTGPSSARSSPVTNLENDDTAGPAVEEKSREEERKPIQWKVPSYGEPSGAASVSSDNSVGENSTQNDFDEDNRVKERREEERREEMELERERKENEFKYNENQRREELAARKKEEERVKLEEEMRKRKIQEEEEEKCRRKLEEEEAKRRTPGEELKKLIHQFSLVSQNNTCSIGELNQERIVLFEKRVLAEKQERLATQQISQAETQQMEAAEQEDFDLADRLAAVIEQHEGEKKERLEALQNIERLIEELDSKRIDKGQKLLSCFEDVQTQLDIFLEKQENSDIKDSSELLKKFETDTKRLAAENERLATDLKNIERDEGFVQEERAELESTISEQTGDIEIMRDEANLKLKGINEEIDELRKQLAEKEMQAAEVKMELHDHEESIENVRSTFSRQVSRLAKKEAATKESRKEWDAEELSYKNSRSEHEAEVTAHSEALIAHDNLLAEIKKEKIVAEKLATVIAKEIVVTKSGNDDTPDEEAKIAQADVLTCEAAVDEANQVLMATKSCIDNLRDEISTFEVRLPILEAEKKQAAMKRDFKAAAKASKAIKEMVAKKERCEAELSEEVIERLSLAQKEVDVCLKSLEEKRALSHEKEKEGGRKRMIQLVKKIIKLEKLREDICGPGEDECGGESISSVGGFVLDSEIAALVSEGEELGTKYGGWSEIMLECAEENEGEEEEGETMEDKGEIQSGTEVETGGSSEVITDEEVVEAQLADDNYTEVDSTAIDKVSYEELLKRCKAILAEIEEIESEIDNAIEEEDYDLAAALDDKAQKLKDELQALGLTDSEIELAKVTDIESADDSKASSVGTDKSYDMVSSKPEGNGDDETQNDIIKEQDEEN